MPPSQRGQLPSPTPTITPKSASLQWLPVLGLRQLVLGHTNGDREGPGHLGGGGQVGTLGIKEASHSDLKPYARISLDLSLFIHECISSFILLFTPQHF